MTTDDLPAPLPVARQGHSRLGLAIGTAQYGMMAAGFLYLAGRDRRRPGDPLFSLLWDVIAPLALAGLGVLAVALAARTASALVHAGRPYLAIIDVGLSLPAVVREPILWADIADVASERSRRRAWLTIVLKTPRRRRFWPFGTTRLLTAWVDDPIATAAAIRAHPRYAGAYPS